MPADPRAAYRFGDYTLDPLAYELRRGGRSVRLERQPMEVLILLVRRHGELISRSEIADRLWGKDVFVDVETGIHTVIRKIRLALRDTADAPRFVATVSGKGYRFIAPVGAVANEMAQKPAPAVAPRELPPVAPESTMPVPGAALPSGRILLVAIGLSILVGALIATSWFNRRPPGPSAVRLTLATANRLVTNVPGSSGGPSFSPDGRMLAYHKGPEFSLWVQRLDGGEPLQLASHGDGASFPVWSPGGDRILYTSSRGIMSVSPLGGPSTFLLEGAASPSFSADGTRLVFEKGGPEAGIYTANPDGTNQRRIVARSGAYGSAVPSVSPDGRYVAYIVHERPGVSDLWSAPLEGGEPRQITFDRTDVGRPAWLPDGTALIFHSSRGGSQTLWRVPISGGDPAPVTTGAGQDRNPHVSPDGRRIVYQNIRYGSALRLFDVASRASREVLRGRENVLHPRFSPSGGEVVYFVGTGATFSLLTVAVDGSGRRQVAPVNGAFPRYSADGQSIHFLAAAAPSLMKVAAKGGPPVEVWSWPEWRDGWSAAMYAIEVDPAGTAVAYSRIRNRRAEATVVSEMTTGRATPVQLPLVQFRWTADGQWIVGTHESTDDPPIPSVIACARENGQCRRLAEGFFAVPDPAAETVWFLRSPSELLKPHALWSVPFAGGQAVLRGELDMLRNAREDVAFDISPAGQVVHVAYTEESVGELWLADLQ
jgi:Tol biopolymer transport system component/DNA-binding winged helix-turn-helix (wHTH) protein